MALPSYLSRREGRYYLQVRLAPQMAHMFGRQLFRASLRTADYRQARRRLSECMGWFHRMNDSTDFVALFQRNVVELQRYLQDSWPISDERLFARKSYEELLKNLTRKAMASGCDPQMVEPDYFELFKRFVSQNVDAESWLRRAEAVHHYERGRADMQAAFQFGAAPASFWQSRSAVTPTSWPSVNEHPIREAPDPYAKGSYSHQESREAEPSIWHGTEPQVTNTLAATDTQDHTAAAFLFDSPAKEDEQDVDLPALTFSKALAEFLEEDLANKGNADARGDIRLIVQFLIDQMGDPVVQTFGEEAVRQLDKMLPDIPDRTNIPRDHTKSLSLRYDYARRYGWEGLKRLTEARLRNGYHNSLSKFFGWLIDKRHYPHKKPTFNKVSGENLVSISRDAFEDAEVIKVFSQPLFLGCHGVSRIWKLGSYFIQSHLYWGYVLLILTGLRPGELGQLEHDDIEERDGIFYLHLRGFNPAKGRVALKDVKRFKTEASQRVIPLHPLIIDLGLLERIKDLQAMGCGVLFPEWEPYVKPNGALRWGQPITKSFQYLKKEIGLNRADVALYSTRHWFAGLIDNTDIKHVTRVRVMGHSTRNDMPSRYGAKKRLTTRDLAQIVQTPSPVIDEMSSLLLGAKDRADRGELIALKPWTLTANWSEHYRRTLLGQ
jgi:integrase